MTRQVVYARRTGKRRIEPLYSNVFSVKHDERNIILARHGQASSVDIKLILSFLNKKISIL